GRRVEGLLQPWPSFVGLKGGLVLCPRCGRVIEELKCEELKPEEEDYIRKKFVEEDFAGTAFMYEWGRLIVPTVVYGFSYRALARITAKKVGTRAGLFLDVATGTGMVAMELGKIALHGWILGIDLALEMLKLGRRKAERRGLENITFVKGDAERLPFKDQTFDGVTCQASFNLFPQPEVALAEMWRVMKRGSKLAMSVVCLPPRPNPLMRAFLYIGEKIGHQARFFSGDEILEMLEKRGFEGIDSEWHGAAMLVEAEKK
ncbi:MAG: class I SAM-dependent methyltransferase, partial [Hadesarchaea archaeon]|nr:class I SAM-dependent methyltransferase [Hadesarchaea archaeon]